MSTVQFANAPPTDPAQSHPPPPLRSVRTERLRYRDDHAVNPGQDHGEDRDHDRVVARLQQLKYRTSSKLFRYADHLAMAMPDPQAKQAVSHLALQAAHLLAPPAIAASDLVSQLAEANNTRAVTSGRPSLDTLLSAGRGGWLPGRMYELAGAAGVGKTELLYSMVAANLLALPPQSTIVWIDSVLGFSPQRLAAHLTAQIGQRLEPRELSPLLNRVHVAQCPSTDSFFPLISVLNHSLSSPVDSHFGSIRLIILDSIHAFLAPTVGDSSDQWLFLARQVTLQLKHLAHALAVPVIVTNNASRWNKRNKPALGQAWQYCVDEGLILFEDEKGKRKVEVLKSGYSSVPRSIDVPFMNLTVTSVPDS